MRIENHLEFAEFIERLLRAQLGEWEIDDFESLPFPKNSNLECWRRCILQIAFASDPSGAKWLGPGGRTHLQNIAEALRYVASSENYGGLR